MRPHDHAVAGPPLRARDKAINSRFFKFLPRSAWAHADGNGFNLQLETVPLDGRVALRIANGLRACLKIARGAVFEQRAGWRCEAALASATRENTLHGSSTEEQRSQPAVCSNTFRAAGLLAVGGVGSVVTAHSG